MKASLVLVMILAATLAATSTLWATDQTAEALTEQELRMLSICEGVVELFRQHPDEAWPGYSLAEMPFIFYVQDEWVLLLNYDGLVEGFEEYPGSWPEIGTNVLYHEGQYKNLAGQLAFYFDLGPIQTVAVGIPASLPESLENPELKVFAYIVHEAFHQFQHAEFGEIPWEREERYPIEDSENAALAFLEMLLLVDALEAMQAGDRDGCRDLVEQFASVRDHRWERADPFVVTYEQGQDIREATAKYVEVRCVELMAGMDYDSAFEGLVTPLRQSFASVSMPGYLIDDFGDRMADGHVPLEDLTRNRIYPVGSALGYLLDYLGIEWKDAAQLAGEQFTFAALIRGDMDPSEHGQDEVVAAIKDRYGYERILAASAGAVSDFAAAYSEALAEFESRGGHRIEVTTSSNNVSRSRSSLDKKWVVDGGSRTLCNRFKVYSLEGDAFTLQVLDNGILEENDWDAKRRNVVLYIAEIPTIMLDGVPFDRGDIDSQPFTSLEILGEGFKLESTGTGTISAQEGDIFVDLTQ